MLPTLLFIFTSSFPCLLEQMEMNTKKTKYVRSANGWRYCCCCVRANHQPATSAHWLLHCRSESIDIDLNFEVNFAGHPSCWIELFGASSAGASHKTDQNFSAFQVFWKKSFSSEGRCRAHLTFLKVANGTNVLFFPPIVAVDKKSD